MSVSAIVTVSAVSEVVAPAGSEPKLTVKVSSPSTSASSATAKVTFTRDAPRAKVAARVREPAMSAASAVAAPDTDNSRGTLNCALTGFVTATVTVTVCPSEGRSGFTPNDTTGSSSRIAITPDAAVAATSPDNPAGMSGVAVTRISRGSSLTAFTMFAGIVKSTSFGAPPSPAAKVTSRAATAVTPDGTTTARSTFRLGTPAGNGCVKLTDAVITSPAASASSNSSTAASDASSKDRPTAVVSLSVIVTVAAAAPDTTSAFVASRESTATVTVKVSSFSRTASAVMSISSVSVVCPAAIVKAPAVTAV